MTDFAITTLEAAAAEVLQQTTDAQRAMESAMVEVTVAQSNLNSATSLLNSLTTFQGDVTAALTLLKKKPGNQP